jgi:hypothetical protein
MPITTDITTTDTAHTPAAAVVTAAGGMLPIINLTLGRMWCTSIIGTPITTDITTTNTAYTPAAAVATATGRMLPVINLTLRRMLPIIDLTLPRVLLLLQRLPPSP